MIVRPCERNARFVKCSECVHDLSSSLSLFSLVEDKRLETRCTIPPKRTSSDKFEESSSLPLSFRMTFLARNGVVGSHGATTESARYGACTLLREV